MARINSLHGDSGDNRDEGPSGLREKRGGKSSQQNCDNRRDQNQGQHSGHRRQADRHNHRRYDHHQRVPHTLNPPFIASGFGIDPYDPELYPRMYASPFRPPMAIPWNDDMSELRPPPKWAYYTMPELRGLRPSQSQRRYTANMAIEEVTVMQAEDEEPAFGVFKRKIDKLESDLATMKAESKKKERKWLKWFKGLKKMKFWGRGRHKHSDKHTQRDKRKHTDKPKYNDAHNTNSKVEHEEPRGYRKRDEHQKPQEDQKRQTPRQHQQRHDHYERFYHQERHDHHRPEFYDRQHRHYRPEMFDPYVHVR